MASPPASRIHGAPAEQALLPDEILEDIFLRLDSGNDLARASATCRFFRRVATGHPFLRRFTSLHPPPVVGLIAFEPTRGLYPADPPHRSAPAARALKQAGDYTFSFLPNASHPNSGWCIRDVRDGRVLLARKSIDASTFLELVVCDPLYRRYVQIPPIPRDLVPRMPSWPEMESEPFLEPSGQELEKNSHFRVFYNWLSDYKVVSFVFSSATGKWCCAASFSFLPARLIRRPRKLKRYYARSCFYWVHPWEEYMLLLDSCEMKFSLVLNDKPSRGQAFMDAAENRLGLLIVDGRKLDLYTKTCQNNGVGEEEWRHDKFICLPQPYNDYTIIGAAEGYLLLEGCLYNAASQSPALPRLQCFVVNLETWLVERLCTLDDGFRRGLPYANFPPPFSVPRL